MSESDRIKNLKKDLKIILKEMLARQPNSDDVDNTVMSNSELKVK